MALTKERAVTIIALSSPLILAQVSQTVINLVDTGMVGHLGDSALAAVGLGGTTSYALQGILMGFPIGVQILTARRHGAKESLREVSRPLTTALWGVTLVGFVMTLTLLPLSTQLYPLLSDDPQVISLGTQYFQMRVLGIPFMAITLCLGNFWNALKKPHVYMATLLFVYVCNVLISYALIFGHGMGVVGAGLGTALSWALGALAQGVFIIRRWGLPHLPWRPQEFQWPSFLNLAKLSLPNSAQQTSFFMGMMVFYGIIGRVGTADLAGAHVLMNILFVATLIGLGFGLGSATLVGQALGAGDEERAFQWGTDSMKICFVLMLGLSVMAYPFSDLILSAFILDPNTRALASSPLKITLAIMALESAGFTLMFNCIGAGDTSTVMKASMLLQWGLLLPVAYGLGIVLGQRLEILWIWFIATRLLQQGVFASLWFRRTWKNATPY